MLQYETIHIWESIHEILINWIESVIREGWDLYRSEAKINKIAKTLTEEIALALNQDYGINVEKITHLYELFHPTIFTWIDNILLIKWGFYRDPNKFKESAIFIARDLIKIFLEEEKKENQLGS